MSDPGAPPIAVDFQLANPVDEVFAVDGATFDDSSRLSNLGLIMFILISDWKQWVDRRVETIRFLDPDTVRRQVSVDMTVPALPAVLRHEGKPLRLMPLGLLRKRRLVQFDLLDESHRVLPLLSSRSNGALAAATLAQAARAFAQKPGSTLPPRLAADLWAIATEPAQEALKVWTRLAQADPNDPGDVQWRHTLTRKWRFMALANDLARNFMVVTPLQCDPGDRRVIKFAYTEPAQVSGTRRLRWQPIRQLKGMLANGEAFAPAPGRRCTLSVTARVADAGEPLPGLTFTITPTPTGTVRHAITAADGAWAEQLDAGTHNLRVTTPSGFILTSPESALTILLEDDHELLLEFRRVPKGEESPASELTWRSRRREQVGFDPKTIDITAPAAGQARSYHLEYVVSEGMQATFASLSELPAAQPAEPAGAAEGRTDYHRATQDRVHLYLSNVPQEYTATATIKLRPRTSTVVRSGTLASLLSLAMITVVRLRWQALGVGNLGTEVALLLAVPGGLSAYVARGQADRFTTIVLSGLRALAFTPTVWCLAAGTSVLISRAVHVERQGALHVGSPLDWTNHALEAVIALNLATAVVMAAAFLRAARPPETRQLIHLAAEDGEA
jgi:hypothetical protein